MSLAAPSDDYDVIRERLREIVVGGLDRTGPALGPGDVELIALELARPFADSDVPREAASILTDVLVERGDALAAGVLVALERLTLPPLSLLAAAAAVRLARTGVSSPWADALGTLAVQECYAIRPGDGAHEILGVLLCRPGSGETQAALVFLASGPDGEVVVDGELTPAESEDGLRAMLREPHPSVEGHSIEAADCALRLCGVLEHMVDAEHELPAAALAPVLVLERALTGDHGGWPRPFLASAHAEADARDEEELRQELERLVEGFELSLDWRRGERRLLEHAGLGAHLLCSWKIDHAEDRRLEHWRAEELAEFLLDWYPREGDSRRELVEALPSCLEAFFCFLDRTGRLAGDGVEVLLRLIGVMGTRFVDRALDAGNWGPTKRLVAEMRSDGVDVGDAAAVAGWLEAFNARSFAERDRVVGPALTRRVGEPGAPASRERRARTKRRDARAPRRRNRR